MATDGWQAKVDERVLGINDFQEIRREVQPVAGVWQAFAQEIGLMPSDVRELDLAHHGDPSRCLDNAIEKWLNQNYNTERFGLPSWKSIVVGIKQSGNPALAKRIAESHPKPKSQPAITNTAKKEPSKCVIQ